MLPTRARLRASRDFQTTFRLGVRAGRPTLVIHARVAAPAHPQLPAPGSPRVGFVVSKAVGNAVTRNRVKRRLRHLVAAELATTALPADLIVVVRALPAAAAATSLAGDLHGAWQQAVARAVAA